MTAIAPKESFDTLCELGARFLSRVIAIDSQSDAGSSTIPSTEGQRRLSDDLAGFFGELGFATATDESANLLVAIPGNAGDSAPKVAFMVHMDTAEGTLAVPSLQVLSGWDGGRIPFPENQRLQVSVELYPETEVFVGQDLLHGPGQRAIGLDDKLGMAEMMLLAHILAKNPDIPRPDLVLVGRPDEEIGRMAAVEGLADELVRRGVTHGYTIDGLDPFEINTENFNAAYAKVAIAGQPLTVAPAAVAREVALSIEGAKSHGATAKAEGYFNATMAFVEAFESLTEPTPETPIPVGFVTDATAETNAVLRFHLRGADEAALDAAEAALLARFEKVLAPHAFKGAQVQISERQSTSANGPLSDEYLRLHGHLRGFLDGEGPTPLLSEHSDGYQGYSNPHAVAPTDGGLVLSYRLRDFSPDGLAARKAHIEALCADGSATAELGDQYVNMGPALAPYPELVQWAQKAAESAGVEARRSPIRGGTGVDPFLERKVPIANVGTGYFAPESEKEFTSRQMLARHALWLSHLVQVIAAHRP